MTGRRSLEESCSGPKGKRDNHNSVIPSSEGPYRFPMGQQRVNGSAQCYSKCFFVTDTETAKCLPSCFCSFSVNTRQVLF